ncbi:SMC-Scp complex subunit ScpB [Roseospira visakhapatnamensis]|uniref:Segregation and condensation protein B n=1 Tax=Roseospira visakhapatnamensis TaxID=390880 RepID=A0A7W6RCH5_9PROT|nr:SMC-Scp complex subunit ScpB [Roseospira visakhapatnamensis]MBB4265827.1 segregation and condensation protein B [Roseospira visakhapatnamensis]
MTDAPPPPPDEFDLLRRLEALLFAAAAPLTETDLKARLPAGADVAGLLRTLSTQYSGRGVTLVRRGGTWAFRTAPDLAEALTLETVEPRKLSRAAVETLAIIAYHQPVTRAEIEEIRGVTVSKGTLDVLLEAGWIRPRGRRQSPGRPLTWGTNDAFLDHFGLESLKDLPGIAEMRAAGLLDARPALAAYGARAGADDGALEDVDDADLESATPPDPLDPDGGL